MKTAAIYARVSSDQQREDRTVASQTAAVMAFASTQGCSVPAEWIFEDEGFSGATLVRPGLERVRDLFAKGQMRIFSPSRTEFQADGGRCFSGIADDWGRASDFLNGARLTASCGRADAHEQSH